MAGVTGSVCTVAQGSEFLLSLGQQVLLASGNNQQSRCYCIGLVADCCTGMVWELLLLRSVV